MEILEGYDHCLSAFIHNRRAVGKLSGLKLVTSLLASSRNARNMKVHSDSKSKTMVF